MKIKEKLSNLEPKYVAITGIFIMAIAIALIPLYSNIGFLNFNEKNVSEVSYDAKISPNGVLISQKDGVYINKDIVAEFKSNTLEDTRSVNLPPPGSSIVINPNNISLRSIDTLVLKTKDNKILYRSNFSENESKINIKGRDYYTPYNETLDLNLETFVRNESRIEEYTWDTGLNIVENQNFSQTYTQNRTYNASLKVEYKNGYKLLYRFDVNVGNKYNTTNSDIYFRVKPNETLYLSAKRFNISNVDKYKWTFSDGTSPKFGRRIKHKYNGVGEYEINLNAIYNERKTQTRVVKIDVVEDKTDKDQYSNISGDIKYDQNGYRFEFNSDVNYDGNLSYEWNFGDGNSTTTSNSSVEYQYKQYGEYTVKLDIKNSRGENIKSYSENIETNVLVIMGEKPYKVESVSGNHEELLLPNNNLGDLNPELSFREDYRYVIKSIPKDIDFINRRGEELLTQSGNGTMEDNPNINWVETENTVKFTVTEDLGEILYGYE